MSAPVVLLPDAGPLITLAYADALDLLLEPGWPVLLVDMVLHELMRNQTPTSKSLARWVVDRNLSVHSTRTFEHHQKALAANPAVLRTANLGELAIQEAMSDLALDRPQSCSVFLFEDHKIARASFLVPENCRKISTRAFLMYLEQRGLLRSAADVELRAIQAGRSFSKLRFPPG